MAVSNAVLAALKAAGIGAGVGAAVGGAEDFLTLFGSAKFGGPDEVNPNTAFGKMVGGRSSEEIGQDLLESIATGASAGSGLLAPAGYSASKFFESKRRKVDDANAAKAEELLKQQEEKAAKRRRIDAVRAEYGKRYGLDALKRMDNIFQGAVDRASKNRGLRLNNLEGALEFWEEKTFQAEARKNKADAKKWEVNAEKSYRDDQRLQKQLKEEEARLERAKERKIRQEARLKAGESQAAVRGRRTPVWIRDKFLFPQANQRMKDIYATAKKAGKAVDHGLPLLGKWVSGLDVPDNLTPMDQKANMSKGNRLPDDFFDWVWKHDDPIPGSRPGKKGRLSAWRKGPDGELVRVPRSEGGFVDPRAMAEGLDESPRLKGLLKGAGKIGLLGAAEMGLNYFAPDNPINQARQRGHDVLTDLGVDLRGAIDGIDHTGLKVAAMLGEGLFVDPLVTAFGAGNWLGDRIQKEWRGEKATNNLSRGGYGMMGRFNKKGIL